MSCLSLPAEERKIFPWGSFGLIEDEEKHKARGSGPALSPPGARGG